MYEVGFCPVVSGVLSSGVLSCGVLSVWGFVLWGFVRTPSANRGFTVYVFPHNGGVGVIYKIFSQHSLQVCN